MKIINKVALLLSLVTMVSNAQITLKLSHSSPATDDRLEASAQVFKKNVEQRTNGQVKIVTFPASQLGGEREQLEGVQLGSIEMAILAAPVPTIYPEAGIFDLPYIFKNEDIAYKVLDGEFGQEILNGLEAKTGVKGLAWGENGFRHFTNNKRPIKNVTDLNGLKIRSMESPTYITMINSLGANAIPIAFNELYSSLQQGVVDGQETPISLIESTRFNEVQKYLTLDGHTYNPYVFVMNGRSFNKLDDDLKQVIIEEAKNWSVLQRRLNKEQEAKGVSNLKDKGMIIEELSDEQKNEFKEKAMPVYDMFREELGDDIVDRLLEEVKKIERK